MSRALHALCALMPKQTFFSRVCTFVFLASMTAAQAGEYTVHAKGRLVYRDLDGVVKGMPNVRVDLMDDDLLLDERMASGLTRADGTYDLTGKGGDTGGKPDPHIRFILNNGRVDVKTILGLTYSYETKVIENRKGNVDFGTRMIARDESLLFVYANRAYDYYAGLAASGPRIPRHDGYFGIIFPAILEAGVPWTTEESVHWPGGYTSSWSFPAMFHEFGHRIRHGADGPYDPEFLVDVVRFMYLQQHSFDMNTNQGFAFNEGWAEYFSALLDPTVSNELTTWRLKFGPNSGNEIEGNVAYKLLKLHNSGGGFREMWTVLHEAGGAIHSYAQFYAAWVKRHPAALAPAELARFSGPFETVAVPTPHSTTQFRNPVPLNTQKAALQAIHDQIARRTNTLVFVSHLKPGDLLLTSPKITPHLTELNELRSRHLKSWEVSFNATHRLQQGNVKLGDKASIANGSYERSLQDARAGFIQSVGAVRLAQIQEAKRGIATAKQKLTDPKVAEYMDYLSTRYSKAEKEILQAMQAKTSLKQIPSILIPGSFSGVAEAVK